MTLAVNVTLFIVSTVIMVVMSETPVRFWRREEKESRSSQPRSPFVIAPAPTSK
jgi:hypothetical protein